MSSRKGSVDQLPSGRWRVRVVRDGKRATLGIFDDEATARRILRAFLREASRDVVVSPAGLSFRVLGEEWIAAREISRRVRGIRQELAVWRAHIERAPFFHAPIAGIRRRDVADWLEQLLATPATQAVRGSDGPVRRITSRVLSRATVAKALRLVRGVFGYALEREHLEVNPIDKMTVPSHARDDEDVSDAWTFLEQSEIDAVGSSPALAPADGERDDRDLYTIAIYTGLRRGELFALHWEDVHLAGERPRVVVRRGHTGPTKSGRRREVPLLAPALAAFQRLQAAAGRRDVLVFPNPDGTMYGASYEAGWRDKSERRGPPLEEGGPPTLRVVPGAKSRAGITRDVRFHDLRHTFASHLVMGTWGRRWTLEEVRVVMGHSTIRMTERYAHLAPEGLHAAARETVGAPPAPSAHVAEVVTIGHAANSASATSGLENSDGQGGDRTHDQRRVKAAAVPGAARTCARRDHFRDQITAEEIQRLALELADRPSRELLEEVADLVLEHDRVRLALEVRRGGRFAVRRAVELLDLLLEDVVEGHRVDGAEGSG